MNHEEVIRLLAIKIAQLEVDKALLQVMVEEQKEPIEKAEVCDE